jgi:hypothetical protein
MVISLISTHEAVTEPQLFARRLESLLEEGLWPDAESMVADPDSPPLASSRLLSQRLATLHERASRQFAVEMLLSEAVSATREENRPLHCYALDHHLPTLTATAFATALDISKDRPKTMRAILRSARTGRMPLNTFLRSLIGSILASSGQIDRSAPLAAQIDAIQLFAKENALCSPWQVRSNMNGDPLVGSVASE